MRRFTAGATIGFFFAIWLGGHVQAQCTNNHVITVSANGQVPAKPDAAILTLIIQSSAPLATDAAAENAIKSTNIKSALTKLGYSAQSFQITPVTLLRAGGPYYGNNQPQITGIEARQYVYIFFRGDQLNDQNRFTEKTATAIDALLRADAILASNPYAPQQQVGSVVYALEHPSEYEKQALRKALDQARTDAQVIAEEMGVQLAGVCSSQTNTGYAFGYAAGIAGGDIGGLFQQAQNPLAELPFRYYSAQPELVVVQASASLTYNFK